MDENQRHEIRRYLASLRADQSIDVRSYASAIQSSFAGSSKELQEIIRREAIDIGVRCT